MDSAREEMRAGIQQAQSYALVAALAGVADDLAREIEQTIDDITAQIRIQPDRALADLNEQERQLETLVQIEPDHPAIPDLRKRLDELEARLADRTDTPAVSVPSADVDRSVRRLRNRLKEAETAWLSKDHTLATSILHEVRSSLDALERERGSEIPDGYVALFVLEERLLVLERELGVGAKD
jgi:hypothetical protein